MSKKGNPHTCGKTLDNLSAHEQQHKLWSRRDFLSLAGLTAAGSFLLPGITVRSFEPSPLMASLANGDSERILVLIRLDGGNDGLNTVIPRGDANYYNMRPFIGVQEPNLWALSNEFGMPNEMLPLQSLWQEGMMKIIHNVGYPEPNYSHFRSYDIVASASDSEDEVNSGWIGRFIEEEYPAFLETPPTVPPALQIGVRSNLVFQSNSANMALSVASPTEFYQIAQTGQLYSTTGLGNTPHDRELAFLRQVANSSVRYAETIKNAYAKGKNEVPYPPELEDLHQDLGEQMAIVAKLIKGGLGTRIYLVDIGGFDTHARQKQVHPQLLGLLASSVKAFYDDLKADTVDWENKVLTMTFSEFGRTIFQNGSKGTDHGTGTPMLLFGGGLGQGFVGTTPDLTNPDPYDDPAFSVDFRSVYASVLQDWMGTNTNLVNYAMLNEFPILNGLVPAIAPSVGVNNRCVLLGHHPDPSEPATILIKYSMMQDGPVRLLLTDAAGNILRTLLNESRTKGSYIFRFKFADWYLPPGKYTYRLQSGGQVFQRSL